ncbi:hypothetical protein L0657_24350 [Dyadobacter sp. CY345]|uniref:hypothetical protein n=1 Tax=Dyadobacter sp. CY345 TaxID=2909335 RepID=UPI001F3CB978|nr:hypothetical protein [Dyadobacter sp. CY345]MCF2447108.1 hypothetical protein [Dyadobacter sp. CY345]
MDTKRIEIELNRIEILEAEQITFMTTSNFRTAPSESDIENVDKILLNFLLANKINFAGPKTVRSVNEFGSYEHPYYILTLSRPQYTLLEALRDKYKEISGLTVSSEFSKESTEKLLRDMAAEAREKAKEIAAKDGLKLKDGFQFEKIPTVQKGWTVAPPPSARLNDFRQPLVGNYKFFFEAER